MKKLLYLISFIPSFLFAGFTTDNLVATSTFTLRTSTMVINGTTYYWRAGTGNNGECLTTDGAVTPALTFGTCGGGGITPGSTYYIQNTNDLQSGATFYVSSGTVSGQFQVVSTPGGNATEVFSFNPRSSTFAPASRLSLNMIGNSGMEFRGANEDGSLYSSMYLIPPVSGNTILSYWSQNSGSEIMSIRTGEVRVSTDVAVRSQRSVLFYDSANTNYVAFKSSADIALNNTYVLPASSGTAGQAILTDGNNNLYFGTVSGGSGGGADVRVENQGSFVVNSSTLNFDRGLLAIDDVGEAKIQLDPSTYVGNQSWSDGASDTTIDVIYNIFGGTPPQWSYTDNNISTLNDLALPNLDPSQPLKLDGSQVIISDPINLSDTTNEVTGVLPGSNLGSGSTNYIQNTSILQSGATFYVSSGTAVSFNATNAAVSGLLTANTSITTNMFANFGSPYLVPYLDATNKFTTNANFLFADFANILYGPSVLGTVQMGAYNGATVVAYDNDSTNFVGLKSSAALTANNTYVLPASSGTANQGIFTDGSNNLSFKDVRSAMKFSQVFNAEQAKLPISSPCVISNAGSLTVPALLCDASTDESATWPTILTEYTTTTIHASIFYTMASATSGNVVHNISVMCASSTYTADLDTESFGSVNVSTMSVPSVAGRLGIATMTLTNMDTGCVQGGLIIFKYNRDANAASDTASGDIEIRKIWAREP